MNAPVHTAIVVLTYNRPDALLAVLRSLAQQCGQGHEVWIADDGSKPEAIARMRQGLPVFACPVHHVWHPDVGFTAARARNLAAARSAAAYLIFLDGDCVPNHNFLAEHARLARPGCFINGSRVLLDEHLTQEVLAQRADPVHANLLQWCRWRAAGQSNKLLHKWLPWRLPRREQADFVWRGIRSCNFALWAADFAAANGFDETFAGWGHEDADLVLRLHHAGCRRINGYLATEVFHLWHREQNRQSESSNRQRVLARLGQVIVEAERGLDCAIADTSVRVTRLA